MDTARSISVLESLVGFDTTSRNSNLALIGWVEAYLDRLGVAHARVDEHGLVPRRRAEPRAVGVLLRVPGRLQQARERLRVVALQLVDARELVLGVAVHAVLRRRVLRGLQVRLLGGDSDGPHDAVAGIAPEASHCTASVVILAGHPVWQSYPHWRLRRLLRLWQLHLLGAHRITALLSCVLT